MVEKNAKRSIFRKYQQKEAENVLEVLFGSTEIAIGLNILYRDIIIGTGTILAVAYLSGENDSTVFTIYDLICGEGTFSAFFT